MYVLISDYEDEYGYQIIGVSNKSKEEILKQIGLEEDQLIAGKLRLVEYDLDDFGDFNFSELKNPIKYYNGHALLYHPINITIGYECISEDQASDYYGNNEQLTVRKMGKHYHMLMWEKPKKDISFDEFKKEFEIKLAKVREKGEQYWNSVAGIAFLDSNTLEIKKVKKDFRYE